MLLLRHVVFALTYGALAIAVALTLPYSASGVERWTAVAIGALILIFGAVLHEVWSRQSRERELRGELTELAEARDAMLAELAVAREEVRALRGELLDSPVAAQSIDEVKTELRMLQDLVAQITGRPAGAAAEPPPRMIDPFSLTVDQALALIRDAIRHDRIDMVLQPIVSLPQRKVRHQQAFSRIRTEDGAYLIPHDIRELVAEAGLAAPLDNVMLLHCVQLIRDNLRRHRNVSFFVHVSARSLGDRVFMSQFLEFIAGNADLPSHLVFGIAPEDLFDGPETLRRSVGRLAEMGFRFCLDGLDRLDELDLDQIAERRVRFLKIDAHVLLAGGHDPVDVRAVKQELDRVAIDLIVDGIETEATLVEILDMPIDFGQGALFDEAGH